ncbi:hypothetical protein RHMOL_Rhmol08G0320800 [Rhododendron molle]|uniref:Uncharacterized protein n=1 Tax=Rhododendron molle TaxID=49168 RepID=A0ACC0MVI9_RHOML|nr:hypothetical protein RHMOL_Rhmol08G0320800 [Rhododendron molle]
MAEKACVKRLQKEYRALCKEPVPYITSRPSPNDILEWHYVLEGSEGTPFAGGYYYGKIKFPPEYPFKPPGITSSRKLESDVVRIEMDNSPTTGSVTTTSAEKQRLAKSSLAFNCRKKMFPEYAEKYEQQQLSNQLVPGQVSQVPTQQENFTPLLDKKGESKQEDQNKVEGPRDLKNRAKKSIPTWMLLLLVSIFGAVMALPLLQLRH